MRSSSRRLAALTASIAVAGLAAASSAGAAPPPHSQANLGKKPDFRLTLLHNNDGESKLGTGDSVAGYGGAARFETVVERLRAEAAVAPVGRENRDKPKGSGTLLVSSGDNFLAGLALLLGFQEGPPWPDAVVANALGYDAMTIGNHEFDFGQVRLAEYIEGVDDDIPFITANLGFDGTALEDARRRGPDRARRGRRARRRAHRDHRPHDARHLVDLLAGQRARSSATSRRSSTARSRRWRPAAWTRSSSPPTSRASPPTRR